MHLRLIDKETVTFRITFIKSAHPTNPVDGEENRRISKP